MKRYIIMTYDIHPLGGCQNYLSGKCPYLEERGWEVYVLFAGIKNGKFEFRNLSAYADGNLPELDFIPAELTSHRFEKVIRKMVEIVSKNGCSYTESIIESHFDKMHLWGELLAEQIGAKHMCFNCNELFRGNDKYFEPYLDFYWFKYCRKELYGITTRMMIDLFDGYNGFNTVMEKHFGPASPLPVQEVECPEAECLPVSDWNICYVGRMNKTYVDRILSDVSLFCGKHPQKKINFVLVGDAKSKIEQIHALFSPLTNVSVFPLGNMVPISSRLLAKMSVLIAGSGCAAHSFRVGVPIIIPDPDACLSNGLLGYENGNTLFLDEGRKHETFDMSLQRVLVDQVQRFLSPIKYSYNYVDPSVKYDEHFELIADSNQQKEYYSSSALKRGDVSYRRKLQVYFELLRRKLA